MANIANIPLTPYVTRPVANVLPVMQGVVTRPNFEEQPATEHEAAPDVLASPKAAEAGPTA
jgi:hypothetical protein